MRYILTALLLASPAVAQTVEVDDEGPIVSDFAIRLNAVVLRDFLASQVGGEVGAAVSLGRRFDVNGAASLGRNVGARLGVTWHVIDDDERLRPFVQLRGLLHPTPDGIAGGGGAYAGALLRLGPGRIVGGVLFEAYAGPPGYPVASLYASLGYELDVYRAVERRGVQPEPPPDLVATVTPPVAPPVETPDAGTLPPATDAGVPDEDPLLPPLPTTKAPRVSTRISLKDVLTFDERRTTVGGPRHDAALKRTASILARFPQVKVEVAGHADDGNDAAECQRFSDKRAQAALEVLVELGVARERLAAKGYADTRTRVSSKGPARKRELNRRVDFSVLEQSGQ